MMPSSPKPEIEALRARWTHLYACHLPALALARDPVQPRWPVHLDHCFARIILDNAVGIDKPWTQVVKSPAVRDMSARQLREALELGERLASGEADLVELDRRSLKLRGKMGLKGSLGVGEKRKRKTEEDDRNESISKYFATSPRKESQPKKRVKTEEADQNGKPSIKTEQHESTVRSSPDETKEPPEDMTTQITRITSSKTLTPFRKQTLTLLCRIPRGRYTTYQAMSDHISATSHKTCARAVGNAMRNNPFAPEVPCHRVLSSDGSIGGFNGFWGEEGKFAREKKELLKGEGVFFDSGGKVKGRPWRFGR